MNGVEVVASWMTPAVLFCVLNLMIGTIFVIAGHKPRNNPPKSSESDAVSPPQLERAPSLFERVKSIKVSFSREPVTVSNVEEDVPNHDEDQPRQSPRGSDIHGIRRSKSDAGARSSSPAPDTLTEKSESEKVAASEKEEEEEEGRNGGDEAVDARADDFINMFRQQLKLQRLKSLLRRAGVLEN